LKQPQVQAGHAFGHPAVAGGVAVGEQLVAAGEKDRIARVAQDVFQVLHRLRHGIIGAVDALQGGGGIDERDARFGGEAVDGLAAAAVEFFVQGAVVDVVLADQRLGVVEVGLRPLGVHDLGAGEEADGLRETGVVDGGIALEEKAAIGQILVAVRRQGRKDVATGQQDRQ
jgi:hypothetical protein